MKIYTFTCGGLGDIFFNYYYPGYDAGYFADIKRRHPNCVLRVIVCSTSSQSNSFFSKSPYINELLSHPFTYCQYKIERNLSIGTTYIWHALDKNQYTYQQTTAQLTPAEQAIAEEVMDTPYICVHPFAGSRNRCWAGHINTTAIIDHLCDQGYRVALLGGDSQRLEPYTGKYIRESVKHIRPGLHNLVNCGSVRLHAHLAANATKFIGTQSAYCVPAAIHNVPCLLMTDREYEKEYRDDGNGIFGILHRNKATILYWQTMPDLISTIQSFIS